MHARLALALLGLLLSIQKIICALFLSHVLVQTCSHATQNISDIIPATSSCSRAHEALALLQDQKATHIDFAEPSYLCMDADSLPGAGKCMLLCEV